MSNLEPSMGSCLLSAEKYQIESLVRVVESILPGLYNPIVHDVVDDSAVVADCR